MLTSFLLGLGAGIAAAPHCLGMCGGFPIHLAKSPKSSAGRSIVRQLLFVGGKTLTYTFLGAMAAALGVVLFRDTRFSAWAPAMRIIAGSVTVLFGLVMLGVRLPRTKVLQSGVQSCGDMGSASPECRAQRGVSKGGLSGGRASIRSTDRAYSALAGSVLARNIFGPLLVSPGPGAALALGLGVGFLPCPLPMGMLAAAAVSHSVRHGILLMMGVGLGTAPGLVAAGILGAGLDRRFRKVGMRAAGLVVLVIGLMTIGHATGVIATPHASHNPAPCCCEKGK